MAGGRIWAIFRRNLSVFSDKSPLRRINPPLQYLQVMKLKMISPCIENDTKFIGEIIDKNITIFKRIIPS